MKIEIQQTASLYAPLHCLVTHARSAEMGSSESCRVWGYDLSRSTLRCITRRPTQSKVEWVETIRLTRCDLWKPEIDTTDHISGISKVLADLLDNSCRSQASKGRTESV